MAIVTNTHLSFAAIGKAKATAVLHEWQTDSLAAAAANAQLEGDDITTFQAVTPTAQVGNRCQISYKTAIVSGTQDTVDKAGRQREIVYQLVKRSNELKRDLEFIACGNQAPQDGNVAQARQLRPLCGWYSTNKSRGAGGTDGGPSAAAGEGTQRALTESLVKTVLQSCWTNGGNPDLILVGPFNKTVFSGFTGNATRFDQSEDKKLISTIDVYESDFGAHKVVASRFSRERDCHILDTSLWALAYLRKMQTVDLAKTGDADKGMVLAEYTLEARNQAGSGIVADLVTS